MKSAANDDDGDPRMCVILELQARASVAMDQPAFEAWLQDVASVLAAWAQQDGFSVDDLLTSR